MPEWLMRPFTEDSGFVALMGSTDVARDGQFTEEAHSIDKATEYTNARSDDTSKLDIHMGDTVGDSSLFALAKRPILFNPSWTLYQQMEASRPTVITSHKDVTTVINAHKVPGQTNATLLGPPVDTTAILQLVRAK